MRRNCGARAQAPALIAELLFTRQAWNRCPKRLRRRLVLRVLDARLNRPAAIAIVIVEDAVTVAVVVPEDVAAVLVAVALAAS